MKVSLLQENLNYALNIVSKLAESTTLPITESILLTAQQDKLKLQSTNLEQSLTVWIDAIVEVNGQTVVSSKLLSSFVGNLPADEVKLELDGKKLKVRCNTARMSLPTIDPIDFPKIVSPDSSYTKLVVDCNEIVSVLPKISVASSVDITSQVLCSVKLDIKDSILTLVGLDGFRMAMYQTSTDNSDISMLISLRAIKELEKFPVVKESQRNLEIYTNGKKVIFVADNFQLSSSLVLGHYPDSQHFIKTETIRAIVDMPKLVWGVRAASTMAKLGTDVVKFGLTSGGINLSSMCPDIGSSDIDIEAEVMGEEMETAFSHKKLIDLVNSMKNEDKINIYMENEKAPLIATNQDNSYIHLIMPMFVNR